MHKVQVIDSLPQEPLKASEVYFAEHLAESRSLAAASSAKSLSIVLPAAPTSHRDWRRGVVRDLARCYAPVRVNMVAGDDAEAVDRTLAYLRNAPGVTGQYLAIHE